MAPRELLTDELVRSRLKGWDLHEGLLVTMAKIIC